MSESVIAMPDAAEKAAQSAAYLAEESLLQASNSFPRIANAETTEAIAGASEKVAAVTAAAMGAIGNARVAATRGDADQARASAEEAARGLQEAESALQLARQEATDTAAVEAAGHVFTALNAAERVVATAEVQTVKAIRRTGVQRVRLGTSALIVLAPAVAILAWLLIGDPPAGRVSAVAFAAGVMAAALLTLLFLGGERGLLRPLIGSDNRVSTSKTQIGLWTLAVGYALAYLAGRVFWDGADLDAVIDNDRLDEYLILLGGPFAAGILAKLAVTWRIDNGTLQKTDAPDATVAQVVENDAGDADLYDAQYLIFNFVALAYFVVRLGVDMELPEMPAVLLGLTSASAATYLAAKASERNAPVIRSVTPSAFRPGQQIQVSGSNLSAGGDRVLEGVIVTIEGLDAVITPLPMSTVNELTVQVPYGAPSGDSKLRVTTPSRVTSEGYPVRIIDDKPVLIGTDGVLTPGEIGRLLGKHLLSPGSEDETEQISVLVGGNTVVGSATATVVAFPVPDTLEAGTSVSLAVTRAGSTSDSISVAVP